nr:transmembrane protein 244-like [Lytechinus pictus]
MVSFSAIGKEIVLKLLGTIFSFYAVYYIMASLIHGILRLDNFDGTIPFHYQSFDQIFTNSTRWNDSVFIADFISLECTYAIIPFVFFIFLRSRLWDYTITITALHCILVCLVNLAFPLIWEWWVWIIISVVLSIGISEMTTALIRKKKTGSFRPLPKEEDKVT